jgi:hypothetical protein
MRKTVFACGLAFIVGVAAGYFFGVAQSTAFVL